MRYGKANAAGGSWWIDEPGENEPARFRHEDYPDVWKGSQVSFERAVDDFGQAVNIQVLASLTTATLAERLAAHHDLSRIEARRVVDTIVSAIADAAASGQEISLHGFGKFKVKHQPGRRGRNPSTGKPIDIAASKKLIFSPAKAMKEKL